MLPSPSSNFAFCFSSCFSLPPPLTFSFFPPFPTHFYSLWCSSVNIKWAPSFLLISSEAQMISLREYGLEWRVAPTKAAAGRYRWRPRPAFSDLKHVHQRLGDGQTCCCADKKAESRTSGQRSANQADFKTSKVEDYRSQHVQLEQWLPGLPGGIKEPCYVQPTSLYFWTADSTRNKYISCTKKN